MSQGFKLKNDYSDKGFTSLPISSLTLAINDLLELKVGATTWTAVTSTSVHFTRKAIVMAVTTATDTSVNALELNGSEMIEVQSANNSNAAHDGDRMIATDSNTINNTGTDNATKEVVFLQRQAIGVNTDKNIIGNVLVGSGVNPAAA